MKNERIGVRKLPGLWWKRYTREGYTAIEKQLRLRNVRFEEADRPVELPCRLPRR